MDADITAHKGRVGQPSQRGGGAVGLRAERGQWSLAGVSRSLQQTPHLRLGRRLRNSPQGKAAQCLSPSAGTCHSRNTLWCERELLCAHSAAGGAPEPPQVSGASGSLLLGTPSAASSRMARLATFGSGQSSVPCPHTWVTERNPLQ